MITFETLRNVQYEERTKNILSEIDADFYTSVAEYLEKKQKIPKEDSEIENIKKVIDEIFKIRRKKILLHAVQFLGTKTEPKNMLPVEREFFLKVIIMMEEEEKKVLGKFYEKKDKVKVKFLQDTPPFMASDLARYGPFQKDDEAEIPEKNAKLLVQGKILEIQE